MLIQVGYFSCSSSCQIINCQRELVHITIFAGFTARMVNDYYSCYNAFCKLPLKFLFFTISEFDGVSRCYSCIAVSIDPVRNYLHVSGRCHVTVSVRFKETIEGTDWRKLKVMAHIKSNLQCVLPVGSVYKGSLSDNDWFASLDKKVPTYSQWLDLNPFQRNVPDLVA